MADTPVRIGPVASLRLKVLQGLYGQTKKKIVEDLILNTKIRGSKK